MPSLENIPLSWDALDQMNPPDDPAFVNREVECAALGSLILDNTLIDKLRDLVPRFILDHHPDLDDGRCLMAIRPHAALLATILAMNERGVGVDLTTLTERLNATKRLTNCGGVVYLAGLEDGIFALGQFPDYVRILLKKWRNRVLYWGLRAAARTARSDADAALRMIHEDALNPLTMLKQFQNKTNPA